MLRARFREIQKTNYLAYLPVNNDAKWQKYGYRSPYPAYGGDVLSEQLYKIVLLLCCYFLRTVYKLAYPGIKIRIM